MKNIILLHGALGNKSQFDALSRLLTDNFRVHNFNFYGHDGDPPERDFSIELFTEQLADYIALNISPEESFTIFGYSMGGYVALNYAKSSELTNFIIITLATKLGWTPAGAAREAAMLNPVKIREKVPAFADSLACRYGSENWENVLERTAKFLISLGESPAVKPDDFGAINVPVRLMVGDKDNMVSIEETVTAYRKLKHGSLCVLPDVIHPIEKVSPELLHNHIVYFAEK